MYRTPLLPTLEENVTGKTKYLNRFEAGIIRIEWAVNVSVSAVLMSVPCTNICSLSHFQRTYWLDWLYVLHSGDQTAVHCCNLPTMFSFLCEDFFPWNLYKSSLLQVTWRVDSRARAKLSTAPWAKRRPSADKAVSRLWVAWCETQVRIPARTVAIITIAFQVKGRPTDFATGHDVQQYYQFWHFKHTALYKVYLLSNLSCLHLTLWHVRGEEKCIESLAGKPEDKWPLGRPRHWWTNDIQRDRKEVECEAMNWVYLHNKISFLKCRKWHDWLRKQQFFQEWLCSMALVSWLTVLKSRRYDLY